MPEIIEVTLTAMFLNDTFENYKLIEFNILGGRYKNKSDKMNISLINDNLPLNITSVNSKGKFMWFALNNGKNDIYMASTFGLFGGWGLCKNKHSYIELVVEKNNVKQNIYYTDQMSFGTIKIMEKKELDVKLKKLAPDFLKENFTKKDLFNRFHNYLYGSGKLNVSRGNKKIIEILMSQQLPHSLGSGLGNYLAVEILYHAKISPHTTMIKLYQNKNIINKLYDAIKYVVKLSYMTSVESEGYFEECDDTMKKYVINIHKLIRKDKTNKYNYISEIDTKDDVFRFKVYGRKGTDYKGNPVQIDNIIKDRKTYWVPTVQTFN